MTSATIDTAISAGVFGADRQSDRGVHAAPLGFGEVEPTENRCRRGRDWRPARRIRRPRPGRHGSSLPRVRPGWRSPPRWCRPDRSVRRSAQPRSPARRTASTSASAIGVAPKTCTSGAGTCGSRKISSAPPDRHGLTTTQAPGASGKCTSPSGSTRSSTLSSVCSAPSAALRTEFCAQWPPTKPSIVPSAQQDRFVAGMRRGGLLRAHDGGVDERRPRAPQLLRPFVHRHRDSHENLLDRRGRRCPAWPPTPATASAACRRAGRRTAPARPRPR